MKKNKYYNYISEIIGDSKKWNFDTHSINRNTILTLGLLLGIIFNINSYAATKYKIACIGDSNTFGAGVDGKEKYSYPGQLQHILGENYEVINYGLNNSCIENETDLPYMSSDIYKQAVEYNADTYVVMLGTNDAKTMNFKGKEKFKSDYINLINMLGKDKVIIMEIAPVNYEWYGEYDKDVISHILVGEINSLIREIATETGVKLIKNFDELNEIKEKSFVFDGVHMNQIGLSLIANNVSETILTKA